VFRVADEDAVFIQKLIQKPMEGAIVLGNLTQSDRVRQILAILANSWPSWG